MNGWQLLMVWSGLLAGVLLESLFSIAPGILAILLTVTFLTGLWWRRSGSTETLVASLCLLLVCIGIARTQWYETQFTDSQLVEQVGERVTITGIVTNEPDVRENYTQLFVVTESDVVLVRADRFLGVQYGDEVTVSGKLLLPEPFDTDTGRVFDYPKYLQVRGVQYVMGFVSIQVLDSGQGNQLLAFLYKTKSEFINSLEQVISSPQVDLGVGLLLGVKQALGDDLELAFRQTGIIHIVVLSGYNVMLVVGFFWWISSWFLPIRGRIVFGLVGITLFALLVGLSATVLRASLMAAILLIGKWMGRLYDVLRALLFAGGIMILINPYILLYDIGFQLSFMATLGLILFLPQFESTLATHSSTLKLRDLFMATLVTQVFVSPLLMYHLGEVSIVSVMVNMLVLPMVPVAMLLTFVAGLVSFVFVPLGAPFGLLAQLPLTYIVVIAQWFASLPFAAVTIPPISVWTMLLLYIVPTILCMFYKYRRKSESTATLLDWTIVEEAENKSTAKASASAVDDVPVILR
jgi:competence protein ComEC